MTSTRIFGLETFGDDVQGQTHNEENEPNDQ